MRVKNPLKKVDTPLPSLNNEILWKKGRHHHRSPVPNDKISKVIYQVSNS